jgi:peptide/nickel transport system ATP-binding protein
MTSPGTNGAVPALSAKNVCVAFGPKRDRYEVVHSVSLAVAAGKTLGIVGESGSGKSVTLRALIGLLPGSGRRTAGEITVGGRTYCADRDLARIRGRHVAMIFQDPSTSLNPVRTIGGHLEEVLIVRRSFGRRAARAEAVRLLEHVALPEPARRVRMYPHELSGGMRQRVMIAMALAVRPQVLLADEPTTSLDVTTQEQILGLLRALQDETGMALIFVTHDLGVVRQICDDVLVMYAGYVVERGAAKEMSESAKHPYTRALHRAMPRLHGQGLPYAIPGQPPDPRGLSPGCPFGPRCQFARTDCTSVEMVSGSKSDCACPFSEALASNNVASHGLADE